MSFVENSIFMFSKDSLPVIMNHEFHNYCCGSVLVSCFSSSTSLMEGFAQKLNKYKFAMVKVKIRICGDE